MSVDLSRSETFATSIYLESETSSEESQLNCEPIRLMVGQGNFKKPDAYWCILQCFPCVKRSLNKDWQFELTYLLIHFFIGVPVVYLVMLSQALDAIASGHFVSFKEINAYSLFWFVLTLLLFLLRILIWIWRVVSIKKRDCSSSSLIYRSGCPYRQTMYAITVVLYIINMCYSAYWQHSPNSIVIACIVLMCLDIIGYAADIIVFCMLLPKSFVPETTFDHIEERRLKGSV